MSNKTEYQRQYRATHKEQTAASQKKWADKNREHLREYMSKYEHEHLAEQKAANLKWRTENPEAFSESVKKWESNNPEKRKAHRHINYLISTGQLIRPTVCSNCPEDKKKIEAHHPDYSKPEFVQWLCRRCHKALHNNQELAERKTA